jgi:hypothetical protein
MILRGRRGKEFEEFKEFKRGKRSTFLKQKGGTDIEPR